MNAIELAVFSSRIESICEEMGAVLQRSAFSPNIKDRLDFSCAIFDPLGELVAQAAHIPVHLGSMAYAMKDVVGVFDWLPGDIAIFNDPFLGGTHLPDVTLVAPVFVYRRLVGFVANRAHHANIGASAPGSMPVSSSLEEEGVLISPVRLFQGGELVTETLQLLLSMDRNISQNSDIKSISVALKQEFSGGGDSQVELGGAGETALDSDKSGVPLALGDFFAQLASVYKGGKRLRALVEGEGVDAFFNSIVHINRYAEKMTWAALTKLPQGRSFFSDNMDDDGITSNPVVIQVVIDVAKDGVTFDFSGSSSQVSGNINCPLSVTAAAVYYVVRCFLAPQVPACAGMFKPLKIVAEKGSLLNASFPAAVAAGNVETSSRIVDVVLGAFAKIIPDSVPAASQGTMNNIAMGAASEVYGHWDYYETLCGGGGGHKLGEGLSARHSHMTNTLNTPIESLEAHYPLRIEQYEIRKNSGGAGMNRGGEGVIRSYRFLEGATITLLTERRSYAPWGLSGGQEGAAGKNYLNATLLPPKISKNVLAGDLLCIETPGGGGYGEEIPD